jgi:hypothetical protein
LGALNWKAWERDRFAVVVGVLAHIKSQRRTLAGAGHEQA